MKPYIHVNLNLPQNILYNLNKTVHIIIIGLETECVLRKYVYIVKFFYKGLFEVDEIYCKQGFRITFLGIYIFCFSMIFSTVQ